MAPRCLALCFGRRSAQEEDLLEGHAATADAELVMGATPRAPPVSKDQVAATIAAGVPGPDPRTPRAIGASEDAAEDPLPSQHPADALLPGSQTSRDEAVAESASAQSAGLTPPPVSKPADRTDSNAGSRRLASSASLISAPSALLGNARNAAVDDTAASSSQLLMGLGTIDAPAESAAPELLAGEPLPPPDEATDVPLAPQSAPRRHCSPRRPLRRRRSPR